MRISIKKASAANGRSLTFFKITIYDIPTYASSFTEGSRQRLLAFYKAFALQLRRDLPNESKFILSSYSYRFSATAALCDFPKKGTFSIIVFFDKNIHLLYYSNASTGCQDKFFQKCVPSNFQLLFRNVHSQINISKCQDITLVQLHEHWSAVRSK